MIISGLSIFGYDQKVRKNISVLQTLRRIASLTNYRLLPYDLGYGIRIGTAAAVRQGLNEEKVPALAEIISKAYYTDTIDNALQNSHVIQLLRLSGIKICSILNPIIETKVHFTKMKFHIKWFPVSLKNI